MNSKNDNNLKFPSLKGFAEERKKHSSAYTYKDFLKFKYPKQTIIEVEKEEPLKEETLIVRSRTNKFLELRNKYHK